MIERERKFLLKYIPNLREYDECIIHQGYLLLENNSHLRVRYVKPLLGDSYGILAYKIIKDINTKLEYEFNISLDDAYNLLKTTERKFIKTRYSKKTNFGCIDIDMYDGGLKVVELEYTDELKENDIPDFCGDEITGNRTYSNIQIALNKIVK